MAQVLTGRIAPEDLAAVVENLDEALLLLDRNWVPVYANRNARLISRLMPEDLNGKTHWELFPATIGTELERKYRQAMADHTADQHEFFYEPFGMWIRVQIEPIPNGLLLMYRDVTALRRETEGRLLVTRRLEQVLDATSDAIASLDRDYRIVLLNRRAREILAPAGTLEGLTLWEAFPETLAEGAPFREMYGRSMDLGLSSSFDVYYAAPLDLWLHIETNPAPDGIVVFFRDITAEVQVREEQKARQEELARQHAEIEAVYRNAPIGLALFDPVEFRYLRLNNRQAEYYGMRPEEILGQRVTDLTTTPLVRELFERVAGGEAVRNLALEGELVTQPGVRRHWAVNYNPVFGPDGKVQAISSASLEITQQKKAEAALIQSEKLAAVGRLATSISHEINNPLESVTNLLYLIATSPELPESLRSYIELSQAELERVSQIATQTLRFHRQSVKPTRMTARQLVAPVLDLYQGRLVNSGIRVEMQYRGRRSFIGLENDLRQVLNNLLANAIDAMRGGGRLLVRAHDVPAGASRTGHGGVRITVADTGHGMPPETQARVFEPFYTTKDLNGTGLGLWISSEIVARHGGSLRLRSSDSPARHGTVFTLFLPVDAPE